MRKILFLFLFFSSNANAQLLCRSGGIGASVAGCTGTYTEASISACVEKQTASYKFDHWVSARKWKFLRKRSSGDGWYAAGSDDYFCSADVKCPAGTELINGECKKTNYCDSAQYSIDLDAAKTACESQTTEFQTATFSGQCNREAERLESTCDIVGVTPPEPELCPDGSSPPCDDGSGGGGSGGGGSGGGGSGGDGSGDIDLSGLLDAINSNKNTITDAIADSRPAVNNLLEVQKKALTTSLESNTLLGVGIAALDVSNDALSNIASLTKGLNNTSTNTNNIISNISSNLNNVDDSINQAANANTKRITDEIKKNNDELKLQSANQKKMIDNQLVSNDLLTGLGTKTDNSNKLLSGITDNSNLTNQLLSNIDESILKDKDHVKGDELTELLTKLGDKNSQGLNELSYRIQDFHREMTLNDLSHDHLSNLANSSDELADNNLNEYQKVVEETIETALVDTPMTEALFNNVKEFANELIPIPSKCQNLSFGDYFTIDCAKFQKFRDIFGFFIYVYTALTLIDILFTGIVPNPARKPY